MGDLTSKQKKKIASVLYLKEHLTQEEIAAEVGVSRQTINKWAKEGKWEELRINITMTHELQINNFMHQIAEINKDIFSRAKGARFATKSEADIITQLTNAIEKLEKDIGIKDLITAGRQFINYVRDSDIAKAREIAQLFDRFLKSRL